MRDLRSLLVVLVIFINSIAAHSQAKRSEILEFEVVWRYGNVTLGDGTVIKGQISFNDNTGIVSVKQDEDNVRYFTAKNVASFYFYDQKAMRDRNFYVMEYTEPDEGVSRYCFFEVLKEFKSFAVLAKIDPIATKVTGRAKLAQPNANRPQKQVVATQTETIFFMTDQGDIQPYLKIIEKEVEGEWWDSNRTKNQFVNKDLFEKFTRAFYKDLVAFAEEHQLSFKRKSDLVKILDHYQELLEN
jgi:hypothetical protein